MKKTPLRVAVLGLAALLGATAQAQSTFVLTNTNYGTEHTFTNTMGSAVQTNGMIVFEGDLNAGLVVNKANDPASGFNLASVDLLVQVRLFDELPGSNEVGSVQGAVAAQKASPGSSNGLYYVWGSTNAAPAAWLPLLQTNNTQFAVNDGATNYITFVFNYPVDISSNVTYQVFVRDESISTVEPSQPVTSSTTATAGIAGVSLVGMGALKEVSSASGSPVPLSTKLGFSVYDTASGIFMVIDTANESGNGPIKVYAWMQINGVWQWQLVGEVPADQVIGEGGHRYQIYAFPNSGLVAGQAYKFKIVDEAGNTHTYDSGLAITGTKMDSVVFELDTMIVTFNTDVNHSYTVKVADSPAAPQDQWTVQFVSPNVGGTWADYTDAPFTAGGTTTSIKIPISADKKKAFFKVFKVD